MASGKCLICQKELTEKDRTVLGNNDRLYHESCFACHECKRSLADDFYLEISKWHQIDVPDMFIPVSVETVQVFCVPCEQLHFAKTCFGCKKRFEVDQTIVRARRHLWHPACFVCEGCRCQVTREFFIRESKTYCTKIGCGGIGSPEPISIQKPQATSTNGGEK